MGVSSQAEQPSVVVITKPVVLPMQIGWNDLTGAVRFVKCI